MSSVYIVTIRTPIRSAQQILAISNVCGIRFFSSFRQMLAGDFSRLEIELITFRSSHVLREFPTAAAVVFTNSKHYDTARHSSALPCPRGFLPHSSFLLPYSCPLLFLFFGYAISMQIALPLIEQKKQRTSAAFFIPDILFKCLTYFGLRNLQGFSLDLADPFRVTAITLQSLPESSDVRHPVRTACGLLFFPAGQARIHTMRQLLAHIHTLNDLLLAFCALIRDKIPKDRFPVIISFPANFSSQVILSVLLVSGPVRSSQSGTRSFWAICLMSSSPENPSA